MEREIEKISLKDEHVKNKKINKPWEKKCPKKLICTVKGREKKKKN